VVKICKGDVVRNLTKTIAAVSLLVPASAYSLGIGDIKLHSALNQTLEAEIALLVSKGENISDLRVRLAPPEKFDEAGIPWSYFLSKMKFLPVLAPDGTAMVKVTSQEVLKEPFLDFLVEVTWEKGSLYREFTVLVDPPVAYNQPVIPVVKPAVIEPVLKPKKSTVTRRSLANEIMDGSTSVRDGEYGPVRRNESLWRIAERTNKHSDVSIEQMMMAIYEANPSAFYGNVNALKAGQKLEIPEKEVILNLSKKQAQAAFMQQTKEWRGNVVVAKANKQTAQNKAQLELKAPVEGDISESTVVVPGQLNNQVADSDGSGATLSEEGLALQARMAKLEQQLEMMKKMLVLKDEQLVVLQKELKKVPGAPDITVGEPVVSSPTLEKDMELTEQPAVIDDVVEPINNKDVEGATSAPATKENIKEVLPEKQKEIKAEDTGGSDWEMPAMSAIAVPLLGALGWLFWRRKKNNDEMDAESMFASATGISLPEDDDAVSELNIDETSAFDGVPVDESSLIGEFETSDLNSFYTEQSDVDPVLEADVYLAYGRHQQAEELMLQAIADQPDRDESKLKLLEVYQVDENKNAFEKYTTELLNAGKHEDKEFWGKVVAMGTKLDIEPGLLGENVGEKAQFDFNDSDVAVSKEDKSPEKVDDSPIASIATDLSAGEQPVVETANEMEFDLSIFDDDEKDLELGIKGEANDSDNGLDFDLSQFDLDDAKPVSDLEKIASEVKDDSEDEPIESFDFDMDAKKDGQSNLESEDKLSNFDFNSLSSKVAGEDNKEDFTVETEVATLGGSTSEIELGGLSDDDELETKIDLAKAYIDMEDADSAKAIAEEVLEKGNAKQKQAAQDIIKQLDQV
jgi:pilus assembly protein FimV